jgi:hypothetical protein
MDSQWLMALTQIKMNSHLLDDEKMEFVMQELLAFSQTSEDVADIYQELQGIMDEEEVAQRVQHGALQAIGVEDDTDEEKAEPQEEQLVDLFSFWLTLVLESKFYIDLLHFYKLIVTCKKPIICCKNDRLHAVINP